MLAAKICELVSKPSSELEQMSRNALEYSKTYFNKENLLNKMDIYFKGKQIKMTGDKEYV